MGDIYFDPAENLWVAYLKREQKAPVSTNVPKERPTRFIQVERTGGASGLSIDPAVMTFLCWAESRAAAAAFAAEVLHVVQRAGRPGGIAANRVRVVSSPLYRPDPLSGADLYQFTIQSRLRGKKLTPSP